MKQWIFWKFESKWWSVNLENFPALAEFDKELLIDSFIEFGAVKDYIIVDIAL